MKFYIRDNFVKKVEKIKPGPQLYRDIDRITGRKQLARPQKIKIGDQYTTLAEEMTAEFKNFYGNLYAEELPTGKSEIRESVRNHQRTLQLGEQRAKTSFSKGNVANAPNDSYFVNVFTVKEIIRSLNTKKSAGPDKISNFVLKKLPLSFVKIMTIIVNNCLNNSYFPKKWKEATILPIPKKESSDTPADFRPISLTNNMGKILERVILSRLNEQIYDEPPVIPDFQFGFRKAHSTVDALNLFKDKVTDAMNRKRVVVACFLDIAKAFDSVWLDGLVFKLQKIGLIPNLIRIIDNFLRDRTATVQIDSFSSDSFHINRGVPQGTILGPQLYSIFTADQPKSLNVNTEHLLYADDTLIYNESPYPLIAAKRVQSQIDCLVDFYKDWGIRVNEKKSQVIVFRPPAGRCPASVVPNSKLVTIKINGAVVNTCDRIKYLGVIFTNRMKFKPQVEYAIRKAKLSYSKINPLMRVLELNKRAKEIAYKQLIRPILCYASPVWITAPPSSYENLALFERKIMRSVSNKNCRKIGNRYKHYKNSELYLDTNVVEIKEYLEECFDRFHNRYLNHENKIILKDIEENASDVQHFLRTRDFENINIKRFVKDKNYIGHRG